MSAAISIEHVDVIFGRDPTSVFARLDAGEDRAQVQEATGHVIGVRDATIDVQEGEIAVLMGLSGSGKSSLLRCVNGLNPITRGRLTVDAGDGAPIDVAAATKADMRRLRTQLVAMVFQQFALLPWRTVAENVGFGLELRGVDADAAGRVVADKLAMVGLAEWADKYAHELSGGMQQRVGLARAFATDAPILLMDEPFSALDPLIRDRLQDELLDLQKTLNKTILFVSHDLDEAMKLGNRIAIMEGGVIVQQGTPEDIVLNPANAYVADFVAHMNPLNVLKGASLMAPVADLPVEGEDRLLDDLGGLRLRLAADGSAAHATRIGKPVPIDRIDDPAAIDGADRRGHLSLCPADMSMRDLIGLRQSTGLPVLLGDGDRVVGAVRDRDIFAALTGDAAAATAAPASG